MPKFKTKSCLVISYGPVPTPQYQTVEGGGMRAWGLAQGLQLNGLKVTVGVNDSFPQNVQSHEGINIINWSPGEAFKQLINKFDAIIISYCMGDASEFVANNISDNVQLILDAYVPIYVEISARDSDNPDQEYSAYMNEFQRFNKVLKRGDFFLCANEAQKTYYTGVLSSLGIINPRSYRQNRIIVTPFGIHNVPAVAHTNPYQRHSAGKNDLIVLWFGGLYPWFRVSELLKAMLELHKTPNLKFFIVGGKNPFNQNPDFTKQYDVAYRFARTHNLLNKTVFFVDWVDFNKRIDWYKNADVVISINKPGEENTLAWRTRVMDYVWGELPVITNGGDPLSEEIIAIGGGLRLSELKSSAITKAIGSLQKEPQKLVKMQKAITSLKPRYYWENVTEAIAKLIKHGGKPYVAERDYKATLQLTETAMPETPSVLLGPKMQKAKKIAGAPKKALRLMRHVGVKGSAKYALSFARSTFYKSAPRDRRYYFISHHMDDSGAPMVLIDIISEFAKKYGGKNIVLVVPAMTPHHQVAMKKLGINIETANGAFGWRLIRWQLRPKPTDFVLMNTLAIPHNYRNFMLDALEKNKLKRVVWFVHEDVAQVQVIDRALLTPGYLHRFQALSKKNKLVFCVPTKQIKREYDEAFQIRKVKIVPLRLNIEHKYALQNKPEDYAKLDFFISGNPSDGRKGQLLALAAFHHFFEHYYNKNPKQYRLFGLHLLTIERDYISQQITWIGNSLLGRHCRIYPAVPRKEALKVMAECNAVVCCSLNETFALYVAEGMYMGHVVLRNDSAGMEEQLKDGVNGYKIDHTSIPAFAGVIEKLLNKQTTSNAQLQKMGSASQKIIAPYTHNTYLKKLLNL